MSAPDAEGERLARLAQAVNALPVLERDVFVANRVSGMSYEAIAERTGLSKRQVERTMVRAVRRLARALRSEPHCRR